MVGDIEAKDECMAVIVYAWRYGMEFLLSYFSIDLPDRSYMLSLAFSPYRSMVLWVKVTPIVFRKIY